MAYFAQLDDANTVVAVHTVSNDIATTEAAGVAFLREWWRQAFGSPLQNLLQCSYNGTIRKQYPGPGFIYDPVADVFVAPRPFPSWMLDANHDWQPPTPKPDGLFRWDEPSHSWIAL